MRLTTGLPLMKNACWARFGRDASGGDTNPAQLIAVPEASIILLSAPGLLKTSGSLLEEYNRRSRDLADIVRRLLEVRPRVSSSIEQIISQIK